jgi:methyl-accepting chemotaxis protein
MYNHINNQIRTNYHIKTLVDYENDFNLAAHTKYVVFYNFLHECIYIIDTQPRSSAYHTQSLLGERINHRYTLKALTSLFPDIKNSEIAQKFFVSGSKNIPDINSLLKPCEDECHFIPFELDHAIAHKKSRGVDYCHDVTYQDKTTSEEINTKHVGIYYPCIRISQRDKKNIICQPAIYEIGYSHHEGITDHNKIIHRNLKLIDQSPIEHTDTLFAHTKPYTCVFNNNKLSKTTYIQLIEHFFNNKHTKRMYIPDTHTSDMPLYFTYKQAQHNINKVYKKSQKSIDKPIQKNTLTHNTIEPQRNNKQCTQNVKSLLFDSEIKKMKSLLIHNNMSNINMPELSPYNEQKILHGYLENINNKYSQKNIQKIKPKDVATVKKINDIIHLLSCDNTIHIEDDTHKLILKNKKNLERHIKHNQEKQKENNFFAIAQKKANEDLKKSKEKMKQDMYATINPQLNKIEEAYSELCHVKNKLHQIMNKINDILQSTKDLNIYAFLPKQVKIRTKRLIGDVEGLIATNEHDRNFIEKYIHKIDKELKGVSNKNASAYFYDIRKKIDRMSSSAFKKSVKHHIDSITDLKESIDDIEDRIHTYIKTIENIKDLFNSNEYEIHKQAIHSASLPVSDIFSDSPFDIRKTTNGIDVRNIDDVIKNTNPTLGHNIEQYAYWQCNNIVCSINNLKTNLHLKKQYLENDTSKNIKIDKDVAKQLKKICIVEDYISLNKTDKIFYTVEDFLDKIKHPEITFLTF